MKPFFNSPESLAQLDEAAHLWLDTPFAAHQAVIGAGVDCVHLLVEIYKACGHDFQFNPPAYALDGGKHNEISQVIRWLAVSKDFWPVPVLVPQPGDVLCFRQRKSEHHVGLLVSGRRRDAEFIHAVDRYGVRFDDLNEAIYRRNLSAVFRPIVA